MKKYITKTLILLKLSFLSFAFVGCGQGSKPASENKKRTATGEGASIRYSNNDNEPLNSSKIEKLNQHLVLLVNHQLESINNKEATLFSKVTQYCDSNGQKEITNHGEVSTHTQELMFDHCQDDHSLQDGLITISYDHADDDGKFPKVLELNADEDYLFNELELSKNSHITVNNIHYNNQLQADALELLVSGEVHIGEETYQMQNFMQRVTL